jgi:hypothetical protein
VWVQAGGVSWRSLWRLPGLGCACVGRRRDGECGQIHVEAEVVDPLVRVVGVARRGGGCRCLVLWTGEGGQFGEVGEWREGCVWSRLTEVLE